MRYRTLGLGVKSGAFFTHLGTIRSMSTTPATDSKAPGVKPDSKGLSDTQLKRILVTLVSVTVVALLAFSAVYYMTRHQSAGPTLTERTISQAENAVREQPNNVTARLALAKAYASAGRSDESLNQYQEILKADPKNKLALLGAGQVLYQNGDMNGAKAKYDTVVKNSGTSEFASSDPQLQEALYFLGLVNLKLNDVKGSVDSLEKALKMDTTDADAWYALGNAQMRNENPKQAANAYLQALEFVPSGWCDPYVGLQGAYVKMSNQDGITYAGAMNDLCQNNADKATTALKTITSGPFKVQALIGLGLAAETSGDRKAAVSWYQQVTKIEPKNVAALNALARLGADTTGGKS